MLGLFVLLARLAVAVPPQECTTTKMYEVSYNANSATSVLLSVDATARTVTVNDELQIKDLNVSSTLSACTANSSAVTQTLTDLDDTTAAEYSSINNTLDTIVLQVDALLDTANSSVQSLATAVTANVSALTASVDALTTAAEADWATNDANITSLDASALATDATVTIPAATAALNTDLAAIAKKINQLAVLQKLDLRPASAFYDHANPGSAYSSSLNPVPLGAITPVTNRDYDVASGYTSTGSKLVVRANGFYFVSAQVAFYNADNAIAAPQIYVSVNGNTNMSDALVFSKMQVQAALTATLDISQVGVATLRLKRGDTLAIVANVAGDPSWNIRVADFSAALLMSDGISDSEFVGVTARRTADQTILTTSQTRIESYVTPSNSGLIGEFASTGDFVPATGIFTVPLAGTYFVAASAVVYGTGTGATTDRITLGVGINGTLVTALRAYETANLLSSVGATVGVRGLVHFAANDAVALFVQHSRATNYNVGQTTFSIFLVSDDRSAAVMYGHSAVSNADVSVGANGNFNLATGPFVTAAWTDYQFSGGLYTAPIKGIYLVAFNANVQVPTYSGALEVQHMIRHGGSNTDGMYLSRTGSYLGYATGLTTSYAVAMQLAEGAIIGLDVKVCCTNTAFKIQTGSAFSVVFLRAT